MIRLLHRSDAALYRELRLQALSTDPQVFLSTFDVERQKALSQFEYELSIAVAEPCFGYYGLFDDATSKLIGFCQAAPSYLPKQAHVAFLYNLYIDPAHRNQGNGRQLLTYILQKLQHHHLEMSVISHLASNHKSHELYVSVGFTQVGVRRRSVKWNNHYDDETEMVLYFKKP